MKRMRNPSSRSGFTLVELTVAVVIGSLALLAIYQTLITQERTYRYQTAAIDAQGSTRAGLSLLASEMREISASAGSGAGFSLSDLRVAAADSVRFRAFRKVGIVCAFDRALGTIDVWVPGTQFVTGDRLMLFMEGDSTTDTDDRWEVTSLAVVGSAANEATCAGEWSTYPRQGFQGMVAQADSIERGALIRSFETLTYGAFRHDGEWVLGRRNTDNSVVPIVGPILSPSEGGVRFQYFDENDNELISPSTEADRARVSRVQVTVRALSRGGLHGDYVDSLTTNVYLRGN